MCNNDDKKKEVKLGETITLTETVRVIRIRNEAMKELEKLPADIRNEVLDEAVKLTMNTIHPYDVTLSEVVEAKKRKGVENEH